MEIVSEVIEREEDGDLKDSTSDFLYCMNIVMTRYDKNVRRGAICKSLCVCSTQPYIHVFKPIMKLALEAYLDSNNPIILQVVHHTYFMYIIMYIIDT